MDVGMNINEASDQGQMIDSFRVDSFGFGGPASSHVDFMGSGHLRVLFLANGGRGTQNGFELSCPISADKLADYLEAAAKSLRNGVA